MPKHMASPMPGSSCASVKTPKACSSSKINNPRRIKQQQSQLSPPEPVERIEELPGKHFNKFTSTIVPNPMMMTAMSRTTGNNDNNLFLNQPTSLFFRKQTVLPLSASNKHHLLNNSDRVSCEKQSKSRFSALNSKKAKPKPRSENERMQSDTHFSKQLNESFQYTDTSSASDEDAEKTFKYRRNRGEESTNVYDGNCRAVHLSESSSESTSSNNELHNYTTSDSCSSSSDSSNDSEESGSSDAEKPTKIKSSSNYDTSQNFWPGINSQLGSLSVRVAPRLGVDSQKCSMPFVGSILTTNESWGFAAEAKKNIDIFSHTSKTPMTKSDNKTSAVTYKKIDQSTKQNKDKFKTNENSRHYFSPNNNLSDKKNSLQSTSTNDPRSNKKMLTDSKSTCGSNDQRHPMKRKQIEHNAKHDNKRDSGTCSKSTILSRCFSSLRHNQQVSKENYNLFMSSIGEEGMPEKLSPSKLVKKAINEKHFEQHHKSHLTNNDPQIIKMYNTTKALSCSSLSGSSSSNVIVSIPTVGCNSVASKNSEYNAVPAGKANASGTLHHLPPHSISPSRMGKNIQNSYDD